jgi:hypothetical protein
LPYEKVMGLFFGCRDKGMRSQVDRLCPGLYRLYNYCQANKRMNTTTNNEIWDPNEIGPTDRCIKCFTPYNDDYAFCSYCGHISTVFKTPYEISRVKCYKHSDQNAIGYCCLCAEPICDECNSKDDQHFSFTAGFKDLYYCKDCKTKQKEIEHNFNETTIKQGLCSKHHNIKAQFECIKCGLILCSNCAYFTNRGWFRKRIGKGPYCLACFRVETVKGGRVGWISGSLALTKQLIK